MTDTKPVQPGEGLSLSRWSRLKRSATEHVAMPDLPQADKVVTPQTTTLLVSPSTNLDAAATVELNLPDLSSISLVEDFTPFMQAKVPQALRQAALKALFKEPHFNVMDGLDTYIDDYTVFEPITPEVMATLSSWKTIMNPPQQVVTPSGYAVDAESDEGKAVLAARTEMQSQQPLRDATTAPVPPGGGMAGGEGGDAASAVVESPSAAPPVPNPLPQGERELHAANSPNTPHPRVNKRVSDFRYVDTHAAVDTPPLGAEKTE